ncbi:uncharacterized protein TRAVEDRAFT_43419 [Trametes versicolor FP-101664 SS1]|uniref:uncharacterized protein n=1 Tax=Trametes versicolor (strain FP-101664) TaxID=717944 RepID=UPI0004623B06|nr:uncharacterized protein TRAVEDRAFT_43419 [Trametes versicolor FP-101664 SS1]EIW63113.1 hypothetical protein TRAVEDRAFT_43419 [Trametes versicolor FP-101664 SS1]
MCCLDTEGTRYFCGHYIITKKLRKHDCQSPWCWNSIRHRCPPNSGCSCDRYFGPDANETVTEVSPDFCPECAPHFGPKRIRRRQ